MNTTRQKLTEAINVHLALLGENQSWLADKLGRQPIWLSLRLRGKADFTIRDLDQIAEAFGIDVAELFNNTYKSRVETTTTSIQPITETVYFNPPQEKKPAAATAGNENQERN